MLPYSRQYITEEDIAEVEKILRSDFLTQGPTVPKFEQSIADYCGASKAVAVNSATSALHIACLALGLGPGDWLWTSPNTFVASANCGLYCGAKIDFVDIDPFTYNLCPDNLEKKLIHAKQNNNLPKIVIPVHFAGQSCDMKKINSLSQEYGFKIIEDASHAIGGKYLNRKVGGCEYSDITVFSFHPVKIITTAEGGLATTNNQELYERMQVFRNNGVTRNPNLMSKKCEGSWYYQQIELGYNYRMNELQAALGNSQLQRIDQIVQKRNTLRERYDEFLKNIPIIMPYQSKDTYSSLHLYPIQIDINNTSVKRDKIFDTLRENEIGVNVHYIPVHTQPFYLNVGFAKGDFPVAENYYNNAISLPIFPQMSFNDQDRVINILEKIIQ